MKSKASWKGLNHSLRQDSGTMKNSGKKKQTEKPVEKRLAVGTRK